MTQIPIEPDGRLDQTHPWQQQDYSKTFYQGDRAEQRMRLAIWAANPATPEGEIRELLVNPMMPARTGYNRDEPTISQVLNVPAAPSHSLFDYSGTPAGQESSMRPSLGAV